jgi:large subunit ribosomal protein L30
MAKKNSSQDSKLRITLVKSLIGQNQRQRRIAQALGLRKLRSQVVKDNTPEIQGMVNKLQHLLEVEEVQA